MNFIGRECTRRCFWLIELMVWISNIYTHRDVRPRMVELADVVRLPIDEITFELTSVTSLASTCELQFQAREKALLHLTDIELVG